MHKNILNIFSENACKVCYELEWTVSTPLWGGEILFISPTVFLRYITIRIRLKNNFLSNNTPNFTMIV